MRQRLLLTVAAVALSVLSVPAFAAGEDPVIARIDSQEIHRSDFLKELQMMGPQAQQLPPQMIYPQLLQKMIATKLVSVKGYADKLQDTQEVKDKMKAAEDQFVAEAWIHKTVQPKITDAKLKERYDQLSSKFKPQDEVRARHILVATEAEANDLITQLKGGADFAKLASEKSKDTGSAKQGGDLGYFPQTAMVKPFAEAAFGMKAGELSDKPVKTEFGYHIIKVEDHRKSSAPPFAEVKDQLANQLGQEMTTDVVKGLEAKSKVEKFNIDGSPLKATAETKTDAK
jgi:peptidyl-prolyl cis-trans isomerase C